MRDKQTKIVATISDRNCSVEFLQKLYDSGMDVVRANTAHQQPEDTLKILENTRKVSDHLPFIVDIKGPEVRCSKTQEEKYQYKTGDKVTLKAGTEDTSKEIIFIKYDGFVKEVPEGSTILIDDGELELFVESKNEEQLNCVMKNDGELSSNKSVNVPGVHLNLPVLTEKDKTYIKFADEHNADFLAQSFVRSKEDVMEVKKLLKKDSKVGIIAKIENKEGVDNIDEILDVVDSIMVARGDLGVELPAEEIPLIQKELINKAIAKTKPPIVATQMLQSMIKNPRPTRAEVSDVANAILDGTSAVMLSGETAYGDFPVEAVTVMAKVAKDIESKRTKLKNAALKQETEDVRAHLARSAVLMAAELPIDAIIVPTESGTTARYIAAFRGHTKIFAQCYNETLMRQLSLSFGIRPGSLPKLESTDELVKKAIQTLVEEGRLKKENTVLVVGATPGSKKKNFLEVVKVENAI